MRGFALLTQADPRGGATPTPPEYFENKDGGRV